MTQAFKPVLMALLVGTVTAPSPATAQGTTSASASTPELLVRAAARYADLDGMCAAFLQRLEVPLLGTEVASHGRLCSKRPAYFRMDFDDPEGDAVVADGSHLWVYFPSSQPGQVLKSPLSDGGAIDFTREFLADPGVKYSATDEGPEEVDGRATRRFVLDPNTDDLGYTRARVWIDVGEALIRRVEIHQDNGSIRHVTLQGIDLAPRMATSDFDFDVPTGVQVITMGQEASR